MSQLKLSVCLPVRSFKIVQFVRLSSPTRDGGFLQPPFGFYRRQPEIQMSASLHPLFGVRGNFSSAAAETHSETSTALIAICAVWLLLGLSTPEQEAEQKKYACLMTSRMLPCFGVIMGTFLFMLFYLDPASENVTEAMLAMRIHNALEKVTNGQVEKAINWSFCYRLAGSGVLLVGHYFASEAIRRACHCSGLASKLAGESN